MGHDHELDESWSAKDGVVGSVEVYHEEVHVLSMEVVGGAKLDWQGDLPQRLGCFARYNPPERRINRNEIVLGKTQLSYGSNEEDVESTTVVDEDLLESHITYGISAHWSALLKVIGYFDQSRYLGSTTVL